MRIESYKTPKSSFLSMDKDMSIIANMLIENKNLKKLLYYTSKDALKREPLNEEQSLDLIGRNIKNVPRMEVDDNVLNYIFVLFDNFIPNGENPEFRDNIIYFDVLCHYDQWQLPNLQLRPFRIAAEIDSMFNEKRLTGIGKLEFIGASQISIGNEFGGVSLIFRAVHGEEDKINPLNPADKKVLNDNFNELFNS